MREILFRGKRVDNGEWVIGYLVRGEYYLYETEMTTIFSTDTIFYPYTETSGYDRVITDTVGQFTGVYDKNGNKIFEGDIVKIAGDSNNDDWKNVNYIAQIVFLDGGFCAIDETIDNYSFRRYSLSRCEFDLEVIGNIHDNPELLEIEK